VGELLDSGERRQFDSGAVRDIVEGKGRCDLLPLDVLAYYYATSEGPNMVFMNLHYYIYKGDFEYILAALRAFGSKHWNGDSSEMFLEASKHYEDGARKYSERNWEKGIPSHSFIDSGSRHYLKYLGSRTDEPHDRAFVWNMLCAVRMHNEKPEYIDLPFISKIEKENKNETINNCK
jgi:hypothetical protein